MATPSPCCSRRPGDSSCGSRSSTARTPTPATTWWATAYDANFANQFDSKVLVNGRRRQHPGRTGRGPDVATPNSRRQVLDRTRTRRSRQTDRPAAGLIYALLGLAIIIALLGIANTLALSIVERTRELGLLRAVGMTRLQLRSTIRWESVIIALQGTILGLLIGIFFGWALVPPRTKGSLFPLPVPSLPVVVLLAALAGVAARPAESASRQTRRPASGRERLASSARPFVAASTFLAHDCPVPSPALPAWDCGPTAQTSRTPSTGALSLSA